MDVKKATRENKDASIACVNSVDADACDAAKRRDASVPCEWAGTIYPTMTSDASGVDIPDRTRTAASRQQIVCFSLSCTFPSCFTPVNHCCIWAVLVLYVLS